MTGGYCEGHRLGHNGQCPDCTERSRPGRRCPQRPATLRWPGWDTLAPCAIAVDAVMSAKYGNREAHT